MSEYEYHQLENSSIRLSTHKEGTCMNPEICSIHNRTDHSMRRFPQMWNQSRGLMMRTCVHSIHHPDPDDYKIIEGIDDGEHDCDGCCIQFATDEEYDAYLEDTKE
jgi:hypothetical protein